MSRWQLPDHPPSETTLVAEISHYDGLLRRYRHRTDLAGARLWVVYSLQCAHRRQLLGAIRRGNPAAWVDEPASAAHQRGRALGLLRDVRDGQRLLERLRALGFDARLTALAECVGRHITHKQRLLGALRQAPVVN